MSKFVNGFRFHLFNALLVAPWMAPEAAANPKVGKTFLAKNDNTSSPKLSKLLKKPPCFCNCVLLKFI